mgnify:CR=1 FL=1
MVDLDFKYMIKKTFVICLYATVLVLLLLHFPVLASKTQSSSADGSFIARLELKGEGPFYVGDSISVALVVEGISGVEYSLPEIGSEHLGGLELVGQDRVVKDDVKGGWRHTITYRLIGWSVGEHRISGLAIDYQDRNGKKGSVDLEELPIKITSLLPSNLSEAEILAEGLKELKKPVGLPPRYEYTWFAIGGLVLLGTVYLLLKYLKDNYRSKANNGSEPNLVKLEPAHLIALRRLESLKQQQLLAEGEFKLYYDQLSEIAREYMENRFQIRALEMTTEEFLDNLRRADFLNVASKKELAEFLQYSDLVKFAKHQPVREEGERAWEIIYGLIEQTKEEIEDEI